MARLKEIEKGKRRVGMKVLSLVEQLGFELEYSTASMMVVVMGKHLVLKKGTNLVDLLEFE